MRVRHLGYLAATLAAVLVLGVVTGPRMMSVPLLVGGGANNLLLTGFLPLVWAAGIADAFASRRLSVETRPVPPDGAAWSRLGRLDAVLFLTASAVAATSYGVFVVLGGTVLAGVGPVLVLSGVACIGTLRSGPGPAIFAATSVLLLTTMYGRTAPGSRYVRLLQPEGSTTWSLAVGTLLCMLAAWLLATDRAVIRLPSTYRLD